MNPPSLFPEDSAPPRSSRQPRSEVSHRRAFIRAKVDLMRAAMGMEAAQWPK